MATLAYFFGMIRALIVCAIQKDRSRFVKFHPLQALAFEAGVSALNTLLMPFLFGVLGIGAAIGAVIAWQSAGSPQEFLPTFLLPLAGSYATFVWHMPMMLVPWSSAWWPQTRCRASTASAIPGLPGRWMHMWLVDWVMPFRLAVSESPSIRMGTQPSFAAKCLTATWP